MRVAPTSVAAATMAWWSSARSPRALEGVVRAREHAGRIGDREPDATLAEVDAEDAARPGSRHPAACTAAVEELERVVDRVDVLPAALHHIGVLGGAATERLRRVARELRRRHATLDAVLADRDREAGLAVAATPTSATTPDPSASRVAMASVRRSPGVSPSRRATTAPSAAAAASVPASAVASRVRAFATSSSSSLTCARQPVDARRAARRRSP